MHVRLCRLVHAVVEYQLRYRIVVDSLSLKHSVTVTSSSLWLLQQMEDVDRRRIGQISDLIKYSAETQRSVTPILNTCIDGILSAATSVNANEVSGQALRPHCQPSPLYPLLRNACCGFSSLLGI